MNKYKNINEAWSDLAKKILSSGDSVNGTLELQNMLFSIEDINDNILTIRENFSTHYYLGELIWYASGIDDVDFISDFGAVWKRLSDDGKTNNSAYGHIIQNKNGFNQLEKIIELLKTDKASRRAVININSANKNVIETKDEPCTIALQVFIRDEKLHMTAIMRSNDLWTGTPYDIFYFTEIQKYIANELEVGYGTYTHFASSLHIYDRDVQNIVKSRENKNPVNIEINAQIILKEPEKYLNMVRKEKEKNNLTPKQVKQFTIEKAIENGILKMEEK